MAYPIIVERVIRKFDSFEEAEHADADHYAALTPQERVNVLLYLVESYRQSLGETSERLERVYRVVELSRVDYIVVGGHAVAFHGYPRFTGDIDFFVRPTPDNAARLVEALHDFGFDGVGPRVKGFTRPNRVVQLGQVPNRIDLLTT
jgi:hypothetical protein